MLLTEHRIEKFKSRLTSDSSIGLFRNFEETYLVLKSNSYGSSYLFSKFPFFWSTYSSWSTKTVRIVLLIDIDFEINCFK